MTSGSGANHWVSKAQNEFLRYSDLRGRTSPSEFWSLAGPLFGYALLLVVFNGSVLARFAGDAQPGLFAVLAIPVVLSLVPLVASLGRRLADTAIVRRLDAWIQRVSNAGKGQHRFILGGIIFLGLLVALLIAYFYWPALALALIIGALLPSDAVVQRKGPNASMSISSVLPPPPTINIGSGLIPSLSPHSPVAAPLGGSNASREPKKKLLRRFWFWISVFIAFLFLLLSFLPNLPAEIEDGLTKVLPRAESSPAITSPEPSPSMVATEGPTPISSQPADQDSGAGVGAEGSTQDDELTVVPVPLKEDTNSGAALDPRFRYCTHAIASGYGPYYNGVDPEYAWYNDRDGDGAVCER